MRSKIKLTMGILITVFLLTGCLSTPPAKKTSSSKQYQHQRAQTAFDELEGKQSTATTVTDTRPEQTQTNATPPPKPTYTPVKQQPPAPAETKENFNSPEYLTAKGFGQSEFEAVRRAKAELANIFESRIMSDVSSRARQVTDSVKGGSYTKTIQADIRIISDIQLEGVRVGETWKEEGEYVAIAALNKTRAMESWLADIKKIDTEIDVNLEKSNAATGKYLKLKPLTNILQLWVKREVVLSRLRVIGYNDSGLQQHDLRALLMRISNLKSSMLIDIDIAGQYGQTVRDLIAKILTEKGFKIGDFESQSDVLISGKVTIQQVKNNNKNFKFSRAIVSLNIINSGTGKQVAQVSEDARGAHLNYDEAAHRAVKKVSNDIADKLVALF